MGSQLREEAHREASRLGPQFEKEKIPSGGYQLVILDEINNAAADGPLTVEPLLEILDAKPCEVHLILTGRNAHPEVSRRAHLVAGMTEVKHPYQQGILAQKGSDLWIRRICSFLFVMLDRAAILRKISSQMS